MILGDTYSSLNDYNVLIIFNGIKVDEHTVIMDIFETKIDNNILFVIRQTLKNDTILLFKNIVEETIGKLLVSKNELPP